MLRFARNDGGARFFADSDYELYLALLEKRGQTTLCYFAAPNHRGYSRRDSRSFPDYRREMPVLILLRVRRIGAEGVSSRLYETCEVE